MPTPSSPLPRARRSLALAAVTLVFVACGPGATSAPSSSAGPSAASSVPPSAHDLPTSAPSIAGIDHKTGATDVVLRIESGGGFVPMDYLASQAPSFTLFGNGVVVFQQQPKVSPEPDANGVIKGTAWRTATLDEGQIQELLQFALGLGGLGAARDSYIEGGIADAPNTIFTINAGGIAKTVTVNALSEDPQPGPDLAARKAFWQLAKRLTDFDQGGSIASDVYAPDRFRGVLIEREAQPGVVPIDWPWPSIQFADFKEGPADGSGPTPFPHRTLTADDVAALKQGDVSGTIQGMTLKAPNGKLYTLVVRPLLADETE